jgi:hypothetical protein
LTLNEHLSRCGVDYVPSAEIGSADWLLNIRERKRYHTEKCSENINYNSEEEERKRERER